MSGTNSEVTLILHVFISHYKDDFYKHYNIDVMQRVNWKEVVPNKSDPAISAYIKDKTSLILISPNSVIAIYKIDTSYRSQ